jgi:hypothetical protein
VISVVVYNPTNASPVTNGEITFTDEEGTAWPVFDLRLSRELNGPGVGELSVSLMHPRLAALTYRNVVRVYQDGELIKSFVIREVEDVEVGSGSERKRTVRGLGLLSRTQEMVRVTPNPINRYPLAYTRRHDWAAPETSTTTWTDTVYTMNRPDDVVFGEGFYRPIAWPTPVAPTEPLGIDWVHSTATGVTHPVTIDYWHRTFTVASESEVAVFASASADKLEVAIDGVEVISEELTEPDGLWWWTWKAGVKLAAGTHTIRAKVDLRVATGQGGFICCGFPTGSDGIDSDNILFFTGDDEWDLLSDPATPPGQTPGQIIRLGMAEAAARGCQTPTLNFSDTVDSNGDPWDTTVPLVYRVPCTEFDVLDALLPWVEFSMSDSGYTLNVVNVSTGLGSSTAVELEPVTFVKVSGSG